MEKVLFLFMRRMRRPLVLVICSYAVAIGGLVLIPGQDDQGNVWHFDFFHAFYTISFVGTTIGFGEIPYALLPAQRFWMVLCIYLTVISWLYAIGTIFGLVQEPAFQRALQEARFIRAVRNLGEPFHIICGYGETGSLVVEALSARGLRCVVLEADPARLDDLQLADLPLDVPHMCGDASLTRNLLEAGLRLSHCLSVIAVTNSDAVNTKIAVASKLLVPERVVMCRAESPAAIENMSSFDTDHIINPFEIFAEHMALAIRKPHVNELHRWLGARAGRALADPLLPPKGTWLIAGYGRFGQACRRYLAAGEMDLRVIEQQADRLPSKSDSQNTRYILGSATDPEPLHEAGIEACQGIIAGTNSDTDNLSIILTARNIHPTIYAVARMNRRDESELFAAAKLPLVVEPSRIVAWRILPLATTPALSVFLARARSQEDDWAEQLMQRIRDLLDGIAPEVLNLRLCGGAAEGLVTALSRRAVRIADLSISPQGDTMPFVPLMLKTEDEQILCPGPGQTIHPRDELLLACSSRIAHRLQWLIQASPHWASPGLRADSVQPEAPGVV